MTISGFFCATIVTFVVSCSLLKVELEYNYWQMPTNVTTQSGAIVKIPATLPITGEQSRAARFQLGLTQANVIEESGLPGHKLKNFETGRFVPDMPFLENLRAYYAEKGIDFTESQAPAHPPAHGSVTSGASMIRPVSRMCFYVSDQVPDEVVDQVLGRMDANDDRIASILKSPIKTGFISQYDEETEGRQRELFGAMAENYLLFRILQGRNIVSNSPLAPQPANHSDLLSIFFAASPLANTLSQPSSEAQDSDNEALDEEGVEA